MDIDIKEQPSGGFPLIFMCNKNKKEIDSQPTLRSFDANKDISVSIKDLINVSSQPKKSFLEI